MARVFSLIATLGPGLNYDIQPPVGQDWEVNDLGSSIWVGVPTASVPQMQVGLYNGVLGPSYFRNSTLVNPHIHGWVSPSRWMINNANYLRITNPGAAPENISASVVLAQDQGPNRLSRVISGIANLIPTATVVIQPPVGQDWVIYDVGSSLYVGAQPNGLPNVQVAMTDGTITADVAHGADFRGWRPMEIYINNAVYLQLTNQAGFAADISWSGAICQNQGPNIPSQVVSAIATVGIGGVLTIQPPVGEEWRVTEIATSTWTAGAPAALPDVAVNLTDGTIASLVQAGTDTKGWLAVIRYDLTNTLYMTLTDTSGAGGNIAVSAIRWRA